MAKRKHAGGADAAATPPGAALSPEEQARVEAMAFEEALDELTQTVQAIERGGLPLADILARYRVAIACLARCREQLDRVDAEIRVLVEGSDGRLTSEAFASRDNE